MEDSRIVYLTIPQALRTQFEEAAAHHHTHDRGHGGADCSGAGRFEIDPAVPIPAEIPAGEDALPMERLSWEMLVSGMIRAVTAEPEGEHAAYYRAFIAAARPGLLEELFNAAVIKAQTGGFQIAEDIAASLCAVYPDAPLAHLAGALTAEHKGDAIEEGREEQAAAAYAEAERYYEAACAACPPFPAAFFNAGYFSMKRRHFARAAERFKTFLDCTQDEHGAAADKTTARQRRKAQAAIDEISKHGLGDAAFREAYEFISGGEIIKGLEKVRVFLEAHSDVWNGWFLLGWALRKLARWKDGAAAFQKCIELGGDSLDARNELSICLLESGDIRGARREAFRALQFGPSSVKVISNLGIIALREGKHDEAREFFRTVLDLDPQDPVAARFFKR